MNAALLLNMCEIKFVELYFIFNKVKSLRRVCIKVNLYIIRRESQCGKNGVQSLGMSFFIAVGLVHDKRFHTAKVKGFLFFYTFLRFCFFFVYLWCVLRSLNLRGNFFAELLSAYMKFYLVQHRFSSVVFSTLFSFHLFFNNKNLRFSKRIFFYCKATKKLAIKKMDFIFTTWHFKTHFFYPVFAIFAS